MSTTTNDLTLKKARLKILEASAPVAPQKKKAGEKGQKHTQDFLYKALETASNCTDIIPAEEARVLDLIKRIEATKDEDKHWETRVKYHLQNLETMKKTYPLLQDEARRRKEMIANIDRLGRWGAEKEKCKESTKYWFDNYAWTADPRKTGIWALPFMLYDYQYEAIDWFEELIFLKQSSGLVEKSRDLGLSWLLTALFYRHWQHPRDGAFNALMGSISSDECDKVGDPSSMFEKLRIQSRLQPLGLLPRGFHCDIPYMKMVNPENQSTITGETSNADFGRSGRYKVILFDEFSAFEQDTAAMTAASQSSPCKIYNSTARGQGNEFHRMRHSGSVEFKTYHWTRHPYKTQDWYDYQKLEMNPVQVAQELDIDYDASQPNKVYQFNQVYHVITQSEIMRALPTFRNNAGKFHIPFGHKIMMGYDVGQSDDHVNAMLWFVTLKQGTKTVDGTDVSGSVFMYREVIAPSHTTPRSMAAIIKGKEGIYEPRMVVDRVMSHEQTTVRDALEWDYGVAFRKWTSDYVDGIARVRDYLEIIKMSEPHPFRDYSRKVLHSHKGAPQIMGRPMLYIVSSDEQGELLYEPSMQKFSVAAAKDSEGCLRTRAEFPAYHFPTSDLGKELKKMRPVKKFDDCMDTVRCVASECFAPIGGLTEQEKFEAYLPENLKTSNIEQLPPRERGMAFLQIQQERREFLQQQENQHLSYRARLLNSLVKK
jgi:hypothetical protein